MVVFSRMAFFFKTHLIVSIFLLLLLSRTHCDFSFDSYATSCPNAEALVKSTVRSASEFDPTIPGKLLRLLFHDCVVEGCDASVLIQGNGTERTDPANKSLGGFEVVDSAKRLLEVFCPETVSCADIVVLAARDAVELTGGPSISVPTGRKDGRVSLVSNVRPNMVDTSFSVDEMLQVFSSKGLSVDDLVTLSGAHTIGSAHCNTFSDRLPADASMDKTFAAELARQCPAGVSPSVAVGIDPATSMQFDNQYFQNLLTGKGLFSSDAALIGDSRTRGKVEAFSNNQDSFFQNWEQSFVRLSSVGVKTGFDGEIRKSCAQVNG